MVLVWILVCAFLTPLKPQSELLFFPPRCVCLGKKLTTQERDLCQHLENCLHGFRTMQMDPNVRTPSTISLLWQHTDDVINLLLPLYIMADIFTADRIWNGARSSHQGTESITAFSLYLFLITHLPHTGTNTPLWLPFTKKRYTQGRQYSEWASSHSAGE